MLRQQIVVADGKILEIIVDVKDACVTVGQQLIVNGARELTKTCTVTCHTGKSYTWTCNDNKNCFGDCSDPNNPKGSCY